MNWISARSTLLSLLAPLSLGACAAPVGPAGSDTDTPTAGKADFTRPDAHYAAERVEIEGGFRYSFSGRTMLIGPDGDLLDMLAGKHSRAPVAVKKATLYVRPDPSFQKKVEFERDPSATSDDHPWSERIDFGEWAGDGTFEGEMQLEVEIEYAVLRDPEDANDLQSWTFTSRSTSDWPIRYDFGSGSGGFAPAVPLPVTASVELWDLFVYASREVSPEMLDETWSFHVRDNDAECYEERCSDMYTIDNVDLNGGARVSLLVPKSALSAFVSVQAETEDALEGPQKKVSRPGVYDVKEDAGRYVLQRDQPGGIVRCPPNCDG